LTNGSNSITLQALATLSGEETFNLILTDGSNVDLTVIQTSGNQSVTIVSSNYSGTIFKNGNPNGNTVTSYQIQGSPTTYSPGTTYALPNGGSSLINTDGTYTISSPTALVFVVTYGGNSTGTLTITVQASTTDTINVEQPSYNQPIPPSATNVVINGYNLTQNIPYTGLSYARFTWIGNNLQIENISSTFLNTSLQIETSVPAVGSTPAGITVYEYTLMLTPGIGQIITLTVPTSLNAAPISFSIGFTPVSVSYDGSVIKGSQMSGNIIAEQTNIGSFAFDGQILTITPGVKTGYSKMFGFTNSSKITSYYNVQLTSSLNATNIAPTGVLTFTTPIAVVGDSVNQVFPVAGSGNSVTLSGKVLVLSNTTIQILNVAFTAPYNFYVTFVDGTIQTFVVNFQIIDLFPPNITSFPVVSFLTTGQMPTFQETGVSVVNGQVLNPNSLGQITMLTPFSAKITLQLS
jgi:hypothetical protein